MTLLKNLWKNYGSLLRISLGVTLGALIGAFFPTLGVSLKPIGDIFLNILFVAIVPLIFFAVSTSLASLDSSQNLGKILLTMMGVFLAFVLISALWMSLFLYSFPVEIPASSATTAQPTAEAVSWADRLVSFFTVSEFTALFSRQNVLALLIFSFLLGTAARRTGDLGKPFVSFLNSGFEIMKQLIGLVMTWAPVGLGAYFAYQVATLGPQLFGIYGKPLGLYYAAGGLYYLIFFTVYIFIAFGWKIVKRFWQFNLLPSATAISTCSSFATMPANLLAAEKIGVPAAVRNIVIPLGTTLHKNGSSMSSMVKIYVAFVLMGMNVFTLENMAIALGLTVFVSIVAGGIPNGGYIGGMLMISAYQLPQEVVPAVLIIGTLVDPMATLLNSTADTVASVVVTRIFGKPLEIN